MAEFKVGEVVVDLFTLRPVRVIQQGVLMNGSRTYLVQFLEDDGHEEWVRESNLRHRFEEMASIDPNGPKDVACGCGFCVALDGGTCADCAGYENVAPEWDDEVTVYSDLIRHLSTPNEPEGDAVNHPSHYTAYKGVEVIQLTEQMNFNRGNAVKYIARAGLKNPATEIEDLEKARWYIDREIKRLKEKDG